MLKDILEQSDAFGVVVAVGKTLVDGQTEVNAVPVFNIAVFVGEGTLLHLADNDEQRGRTPVGQVVVAAAQLDRTEVGQNDRGVVRVGGDERLGNDTVSVAPAQYRHDQLEYGTRELFEYIHCVARSVAATLFNVAYLLIQIIANGVDGGILVCIDKRQTLFGGVVKLLFDDEGRTQILALVHILVGNEAVELGPEHDDLEYRRNDQVEKREFKLGVLGVALFKIGVNVREVDALGDKRLVVAAAGVDHRHDDVHSVNVAQQNAVSAVADALFVFAHNLNLSVNDFN